MQRNRRRGPLFVFTVGLVVLGVSSAAWACTEFVGKLVVTGNGSGTSAVWGAKSAAGDGMNYCSSAPNQGGASTGNSSTATVTVTVTPDTTYCGTTTSPNKFPSTTNNGPYDVNFINYIQNAGGTQTGFTRSSSGGYSLNHNGDCMSPPLTGVKTMGQITIDSGGYSLNSSGARGSRTYSLGTGAANSGWNGSTWTKNDGNLSDGSTPAGDASGICVSDRKLLYALQAPLNII